MRHLEHEKLTFYDPKRKIVLVGAIKAKTQKYMETKMEETGDVGEKQEVDKQDIDKRRFTTGICSEKCVVRRFDRCANVYLHKPR
jgi:hypothetical protein